MKRMWAVLTPKQCQDYEADNARGALKCRRLTEPKHPKDKDTVEDGGQGKAKGDKHKDKSGPKNDGKKRGEGQARDITVAEEPTGSDLITHDEPTLTATIHSTVDLSLPCVCSRIRL